MRSHKVSRLTAILSDLSPLSYIAGTLMGFPNIFVQRPSSKPGKPVDILSASEALPLHGLKPFTLVRVLLSLPS